MRRADAALAKRVHEAATHMAQIAHATGGAPFLVAVAEMLTSVANGRHMPVRSSHRGVLGGFNVDCSCGGDSVDDGDGPAPCSRLAQAHAVAVAYMPALLDNPVQRKEP